MGLAVERFMDCAWEYIVFDRDAKGVAARIGRRLVLPARGGQLPPVGCTDPADADRRQGEVFGRAWAVGGADWGMVARTVASDSVCERQCDAGRCVVRAAGDAAGRAESAVGRLSIDQRVWGKLVLAENRVLFSPYFCACGAPATRSIGLDWTCDACAEVRKAHWTPPDNSVDGDGGLTWYHSFEDED
jgi:hypothetical protein